jgi:hypothetical protein
MELLEFSEILISTDIALTAQTRAKLAGIADEDFERVVQELAAAGAVDYLRHEGGQGGPGRCGT